MTMTPAEQRAYNAGARLLRLMGLACPAHIERTPAPDTEEFVSTEPRREPMPRTCVKGHVNCTEPQVCAIDARYGRIEAEFAQGRTDPRGPLRTIKTVNCMPEATYLTFEECDHIARMNQIFDYKVGSRTCRCVRCAGAVGEDEIERARRRAPMPMKGAR